MLKAKGGSEHYGHIPGQRILAWSELDLRDLGRDAGCVHVHREGHGLATVYRRPVGETLQDCSHFWRVLCCVDILPHADGDGWRWRLCANF